MPTIQTPTLAPIFETETAAPTLWRPPHSSPTPRPSSTTAAATTTTTTTHRTPTRVVGAEEGGGISAEADDDDAAADDDDEAPAIDAELVDDGGTAVLVSCSALTQVACQEITECQWKASASMCMAASSNSADDDDSSAAVTSTADATTDATADATADDGVGARLTPEGDGSPPSYQPPAPTVSPQGSSSKGGNAAEAAMRSSHRWVSPRNATDDGGDDGAAAQVATDGGDVAQTGGATDGVGAVLIGGDDDDEATRPDYDDELAARVR